MHTMKDEHFGIAIVEMMVNNCPSIKKNIFKLIKAGGLITIAHKSAGPLKDIIKTEEYGFLCENEDQYVEATIKAI